MNGFEDFAILKLCFGSDIDILRYCVRTENGWCHDTQGSVRTEMSGIKTDINRTDTTAIHIEYD